MGIWGKSNRIRKSYSFVSPVGTSGIYYIAGFYKAPAADVTLSNANLTQTYGTANISEAAHAFIVCGGAGTTDAGTVSIVVSGTSITDKGIRTGNDSEVILADITNASLNAYYETQKKWIGEITFTITPVGATTFTIDCNYGLCKYDDFSNRNFKIESIECVGRAGANDTGFDIALLHHKDTGWIYHSTAFEPGSVTSPIAQLSTDAAPEDNLAIDDFFAYKRDNLNVFIAGAIMEGFVVKIVTSANKAVESMSCHIGALL